jgi:glutamate-1-semialdehyde 2,1-aminomutase
LTKTVAIVQARMKSTRLPGKTMRDIVGKPAIYHTLTRVARATDVSEVWLACSDEVSDDPLATYVDKLGFPVFRGDEDDVLSRFAAIAKQTNAEQIVRITGDCPATDPAVIYLAVAKLQKTKADYVSNHLKRSFPDGIDVEVFSRSALDRADAEAEHPFHRTHVTPYIHGRLKDRLPWGEFVTEDITHDVDFSHLRWTLDEPEDLLFLRELFARLPEGFHWLEAVAAISREPHLLWINKKHKLHAGTEKDLGRHNQGATVFEQSNRQFDRASRTIPLASQTFSKSHQQWVRGATPLFLESGHGAYVNDPDGNVYIDYLQGLMPNILGYGDPDVDAAIREQLEKGINFSLPTTLEADLAERLVRDIPCAEMVRYGKNGSDATTAAIRLARAYTGRDKIAVAGYHGWHDWYIGSTVRSLGVPSAISGLTATFPFNDADALEAMMSSEPDQIAAIVLEPTGAALAQPGFLERVREIATKAGAVLVFDEIVTGFRIHVGGAQAHFGVVPDLACFGKAMANGMPISAIVGRKDIMMLMEDVFVSGTFGGEALSIAAAIATIDKLARENVISRLWTRGDSLIEKSNEIFERHGFGGMLAFGGEGWWPRLSIIDPPIESVLLTSLLRQAFVREGLILASSYNLSLPHDNEHVYAETLEALERAVSDVRAQINSPDPESHLRGMRIQPTFSVR